MKLYKSYKFRDYDPIIDLVEEVLYVNGTTKAEICRMSGVAPGTLTNWQKRRTRSPKSSTVNAALHAMGYELAVRKKRAK